MCFTIFENYSLIFEHALTAKILKKIQALRRSAPVSHPSGFDGALDREASKQLPPAAGKSGAVRRRSDNPFADGAPFGADVALPAGSATPLLLQQRPATTKHVRAAGTMHSDEESQLLQGSTHADAVRDSIYISAVAGPPDEEINPQQSGRQGASVHDLTDESEGAHLLNPWVTKAAAEAEVVETGGQEDARRGTGNPFAAFLGNPFGMGRTLSRHFGSFTAGGWPFPAVFSALKVSCTHFPPLVIIAAFYNHRRVDIFINQYNARKL